jgi:hypothetical protein
VRTCRDCNGDGVVDKGTDNEKGNNLRIEFDGALVMRKKFSAFAKELVSLRPDAILSVGTVATGSPSVRRRQLGDKA